MALRYSNLGMNVSGYGTINSTWPSTVDKYYRDLDRIKELGFTKVRMGGTDPSFGSAYALSKAIALYAASIGLDIMWGPNAVLTITASNYPTYHDHVLAALQWAIDNGITRFSIGNEMESRNDATITDTELFNEIKETAVACQALKASNNSDIEISYNSTAGSTIVNLWISLGFTHGTDLDALTFQPYGGGQTDISGFYTDCKRIADGFPGNEHVYITEFGLVTDAGTLSISQDRQQLELSKRIQILRALFPTQDWYFFTWKKTDTTPTEKLSIAFLDGTYRQSLWSMLSDRPFFSHI